VSTPTFRDQSRSVVARTSASPHMRKLVSFMRKKAAIATSIAASGSVRGRGVGRATALGAALVMALGVLTPSPVGAALVRDPATSGGPVAAERLQMASAGASTPQIAVGYSHTCALLQDRTVRCWGSNANGRLGDGTTTDRSNPVQVLASGSTQGMDVLGGVTQIAAGDGISCALLEDRTVSCWGSNGGGRLGDGTTTSRSNPVQVLASGTASSDPVLFLVGLVSSSNGSVTVPLLAVSCDGVLQVGSRVTCTVTGGDPGIEILWRAAYNPVFAEAGVTLDASGTGEFSFTVPAAALGQELTVELVEWLAPVSLGVAGGPAPSSVPSGGGPVPVWSLVMLALAAGLVLRRVSAVGVRG